MFPWRFGLTSCLSDVWWTLVTFLIALLLDPNNSRSWAPNVRFVVDRSEMFWFAAHWLLHQSQACCSFGMELPRKLNVSCFRVITFTRNSNQFYRKRSFLGKKKREFWLNWWCADDLSERVEKTNCFSLFFSFIQLCNAYGLNRFRRRGEWKLCSKMRWEPDECISNLHLFLINDVKQQFFESP